MLSIWKLSFYDALTHSPPQIDKVDFGIFAGSNQTQTAWRRCSQAGVALSNLQQKERWIRRMSNVWKKDSMKLICLILTRSCEIATWLASIKKIFSDAHVSYLGKNWKMWAMRWRKVHRRRAGMPRASQHRYCWWWIIATLESSTSNIVDLTQNTDIILFHIIIENCTTKSSSFSLDTIMNWVNNKFS